MLESSILLAVCDLHVAPYLVAKEFCIVIKGLDLILGVALNLFWLDVVPSAWICLDQAYIGGNVFR